MSLKSSSLADSDAMLATIIKQNVKNLRQSYLGKFADIVCSISLFYVL